MAIKVQGSTVIYDDRVFNLKTGTTTNRPSTLDEGTVWYNTQLGVAERYRTSDGWKQFSTESVKTPELIFPIGVTTTDANFVKLDGSTLLQSSYANTYSKIGLLNNAISNAFVSRATAANPVYALTYGNGVYVAAGSAGTILSSTNAINWTTRTPYTNQDVQALTYGSNDGLYVAGNKGAVGQIATSTNAIDWTVRSAKTSRDIYSLLYNNGLYIYGAFAGATATSTNGIDWIARTSGTTTTINGLAYGNSTYLRVGQGGQTGTSTDGINWTARTNLGNNINEVKYGNGVFFVGGGAGLIGYSTDGINWTTPTSPTGSAINALEASNGLYLISDSTGKDLYSTNAINWVQHPDSLGGNNLYSMLYNNGLWVVGGDVIGTWTPYTYNYLTEFYVPEIVYQMSVDTTNYNIPVYIKER